jgi:hypothetical protein
VGGEPDVVRGRHHHVRHDPRPSGRSSDPPARPWAPHRGPQSIRPAGPASSSSELTTTPILLRLRDQPAEAPRVHRFRRTTTVRLKAVLDLARTDAGKGAHETGRRGAGEGTRTPNRPITRRMPTASPGLYQHQQPHARPHGHRDSPPSSSSRVTNRVTSLVASDFAIEIRRVIRQHPMGPPTVTGGSDHVPCRPWSRPARARTPPSPAACRRHPGQP